LRNKVEGNEHLLKDETTGAVINTDRNSYLAYKRRRLVVHEQRGEIEVLQGEVQELKGMVKDLLGRV